MKSSDGFEALWRETPVERIARERSEAAVGRALVPLCAGSAIAKVAIVVAMMLMQPAIYYVAELRGVVAFP